MRNLMPAQPTKVLRIANSCFKNCKLNRAVAVIGFETRFL
jgi:hypothetical protein